MGWLPGGSSGDGLVHPIAAAVNPRTRTWRRLPGLNDMDGLLASGAVWSGDRLFVAGSAYDCSPSPCTPNPVFLAYDMATDVAVPIDLSNAPSLSITPVAWTRAEVLATGQDQASVVLYDPATDMWRTGAHGRARWTRAGTSRAHGSTGDT